MLRWLEVDPEESLMSLNLIMRIGLTQHKQETLRGSNRNWSIGQNKRNLNSKCEPDYPRFIVSKRNELNRMSKSNEIHMVGPKPTAWCSSGFTQSLIVAPEDEHSGVFAQFGAGSEKHVHLRVSIIVARYHAGDDAVTETPRAHGTIRLRLNTAYTSATQLNQSPPITLMDRW